MSMEQGSEKVVTYGRYRIQSEIGRGSMGVVYKARDPEIDRTIALKVLRHDRIGDEDMVRRFFREAKAAGRLSHPSIVVVYDVGQDHGTVFIAMELVQGQGLEKVMKAGPVEPKKALEFCRQVALALDYAHKQGIVHRDVKPSNIIVTPSGGVKITDFGIARIQDASTSEQTQIGSILGTPAYMSPEQVRGERVDGRSDLFSLGTILYEMLAGQKPFKGANMVEIFQAISGSEPPVLAAPDHVIPEELKMVVRKALEKNPEDRFQSGSELAGALEKCMRSLSRSGSVEETIASSGQAVSPEPLERKKGMSAFVLIAGAVIAVLVFFVVFWQWSHKPAEETGPGMSVQEQKNVSMGNLSVLSNPPGAKVMVDGQLKGVTPLSISIESGQHEVALNKAGYYSWEAEIQVEPGGVVPLEVDMVSE